MIAEILSLLLAQNISDGYNNVEFNQNQYLQIQQVSKHDNYTNNNHLTATVSDYNRILRIKGILLNSDNNGFNTYRWQDKNGRVIKGIFHDGHLVYWESVGF
jgi:hypothetical protein